MTTITFTLTPELSSLIEEVSKNTDLTKADIVCEALTLYAEELAIKKVLNASKESSLGEGLVNLVSNPSNC